MNSSAGTKNASPALGLAPSRDRMAARSRTLFQGMSDSAKTNGADSSSADVPAAKPRVRPTPTPRMVLCPFCGGLSPDLEQCTTCKGRFDPLSRQASQNAMGPWSIRNEENSFAPGCSFETVRTLIARGRILPNTIVRGPTTNQFWTLAKRAPSIANLLGVCHNCQASVEASDFACSSCGAPFTPDADRQHMGLAPLQHLPGQAPPAVIAALSGPPLGVEPIEVTRYGAGYSPGGGIATQNAALDSQSVDLPVRKADDTRFWIILASIVVVVTILGAVFGPEFARRLSDPRGSGSIATPGDQDADGQEHGTRARELHETTQNTAEQGSGDPESNDARALESDTDVDLGLWSQIEICLQDGSPRSLETALDLLRRSPATAMSIELRRATESVIERRLQRTQLKSLP